MENHPTSHLLFHGITSSPLCDLMGMKNFSNEPSASHPIQMIRPSIKGNAPWHYKFLPEAYQSHLNYLYFITMRNEFINPRKGRIAAAVAVFSRGSDINLNQMVPKCLNARQPNFVETPLSNHDAP